MKNKMLVGISFVVGLLFVMGALAKAEGPKKASVDQQLSEILNKQNMIEQRLSAIETRQSAIFNAFANALRPQQPMGGGGCGGAPMIGSPQAMGGGCGGGNAGGPPPEDYNKVYKIDVGRSSLQGKKDAKVTIVEFSDFQCPFSQRFHPVIPDVLKVYPNDVKYVFKNFPLRMHPLARPAAKASLAAREQGKYWEMVEALFKNGSNLSEDKFKELAQSLGLNVEKFMKDYKEKDAEWEKFLQEDLDVAGASAVGGTPTFFINGKKTNARDLASFRNEIENILNANTAKKTN